MPGSVSSERVISGYSATWEELNLYLIKGEGFLFIFSGLLLLANKRCLGSLILVFAMNFLLIVKDNPWIRHNSLKTSLKEKDEKFNDFLKNLSLLGSAFILMFHKGSSSCCSC